MSGGQEPMIVKKPIFYGEPPKLTEAEIKEIERKIARINKKFQNTKPNTKKEKETKEQKIIPQCENNIKFLGKKIIREDKFCDKCQYYYGYSNFSKHYKICQGKLIKKSKEEEKENLMQEIIKLKSRVKELEKENEQLRSQNANANAKVEDPLEFTDIIKNKSINTRSSYKCIWDKYLAWCKENNYFPWMRKSIVQYFYNLKNPPFNEKRKKASTLNTTRSIILSSVKTLYGKDLSKLISKVKNSTKAKPKYEMSEEELFDYLSSYKFLEEDFLALYILIFSGCRVHSLAMLRPANWDGENVNLCDYKTKKLIPFKIESTIIKAKLSEFAKAITEDKFIFYNTTSSAADIKMYIDDWLVKLRGKYVSQILRNKIQTHWVFNKVSRFKFCLGPHMFRKTKASLQFNDFIFQALEGSRQSINQSSGSGAINHYVSPKSVRNIFYDKLIERLDSVFK